MEKNTGDFEFLSDNMAKPESVFKKSNLQDKAPWALFMTAGIDNVTLQLMMEKKFSKNNGGDRHRCT